MKHWQIVSVIGCCVTGSLFAAVLSFQFPPPPPQCLECETVSTDTEQQCRAGNRDLLAPVSSEVSQSIIITTREIKMPVKA